MPTNLKTCIKWTTFQEKKNNTLRLSQEEIKTLMNPTTIEALKQELKLCLQIAYV
jgi:hypothetical protein